MPPISMSNPPESAAFRFERGIFMETIEIELPESLITQLNRIAESKGVTVDELVEWILWQKLRGVQNGG